MNISYANDFKHNYLVINDDRVLDNDYQLSMMVKNNVEGLLNCQERMINGKGLLYYDISSMQSLKNVFENKGVGFDDIKIVFNNIRKTCDNLSHYLLYGNKLVLDPEYIYMDIDSLDCSFLYYPYYDNEYNLESLLSYFMERQNSEDIKAVEAVYRMSDLVSRQHLKMEEALEWFRREFCEEEIQTLPSYDQKKYSNDPVEKDISNSPQSSGREYGEQIDADEKKGLFLRIKEWLFGRKENDEFVFESPEYDFQSIEKSLEKQNKDNDATVFIPWVENSEQKLYGSGKGNKYRIDLTKAPLVIGKQADNADVVISDPSISRMHAKIVKTGCRYSMTDLNSTNGSFRNGLRLLPNETVDIEPGDEIGFGKLKFIYR